MTVPVTVIGSTVACFLTVGFGCANAKGASSKQARATIVFFIICLPVAVNNYFPFTKGFRSACCTKFRFFSSLAFLLRTRFLPMRKIFNVALTPGRQRGYILYFSRPKQSKTRESRVEKCMQRILNGKGLNDYEHS